MQDFDENNISDALSDRFTNTPDPRLKTIMNSRVHHLHDFVPDVGLTFDECWFAIDFLTRTGQIGSSKRQEFILLSDTLGISMLVDAMNHASQRGRQRHPCWARSTWKIRLNFSKASIFRAICRAKSCSSSQTSGPQRMAHLPMP